MSEVTLMDPSRSRLERDLLGDAIQGGIAARKWRQPELDWPYLHVEIAVGDEHFVALRILVDQYPASAPAGQPWDRAADAPLAASMWPKGGNAEKIWRVDWSPGNQNGPYMACDRVALGGHPDWANQHPERSWNATRTIAFYLAEVHREMVDAYMLANQDVA